MVGDVCSWWDCPVGQAQGLCFSLCLIIKSTWVWRGKLLWQGKILTRRWLRWNIVNNRSEEHDDDDDDQMGCWRIRGVSLKQKAMQMDWEVAAASLRSWSCVLIFFEHELLLFLFWSIFGSVSLENSVTAFGEEWGVLYNSFICFCGGEEADRDNRSNENCTVKRWMALLSAEFPKWWILYLIFQIYQHVNCFVFFFLVTGNTYRAGHFVYSRKSGKLLTCLMRSFHINWIRLWLRNGRGIFKGIWT